MYLSDFYHEKYHKYSGTTYSLIGKSGHYHHRRLGHGLNQQQYIR